MKSKRWSDEETTFVKENVGKISYAKIGKLLGRSTSSVATKARLFSLKVNGIFTKELLEKELKNNSITEISKKYNKTIQCVYQNLEKFGIKLPKTDPTSYYIGRQFGLLTPFKIYQRDKNGRIFYTCKCECGNIKNIRADALIKKSTTSCGCQKKSKHKEYTESINGGDIPLKYWYKVVKRAIERGQEFTIKSLDTWNLFLQQDKKCSLSGININFTEEQTASLDRIDSSKGYIKGNVQWIHKRLQDMKWDKPQEEFIEWCSLIAKHNNKI
jgi:hypothetical protein